MPTFRLNISQIVNHIINMSRTETELQGVTLLGCQGTKYSDQYNPEVLESFKNKHPENKYLVPGIHEPVSKDRTAGFRKNHHQLHSA